jgi:pilus assembly protein CpaF
MDARALVEDEVRDLVRQRALDPSAAPADVHALVDEVLADYDERSLLGNLPGIADPERVAREVYDAVAGFGPLQRHLDDPEVEELWINDRLTHRSR